MERSQRKIVVTLDKDGSYFMMKELARFGNEGNYWWNEIFMSRVLERLPEHKRLESGWYRSAVSDSTIDELKAAIDRDEYCVYEFEFEDDAKVMWDYWSAHNQVSRVCAADISKFKETGEVTALPGVEYGQLSPYQQVGLNNALRMPGYGLFMKQGTGKTPVAIMAICNDAARAKKPMYRAIVVCPPNVRVNWQREFNKFATMPVFCQVLRGGQVTRMSQIIDVVQSDAPIGVIICNYETLQQSWDALQLLKFDYAILDEAHYIKSHKTKRYQYAQKLGQNSIRRLLLTGTPMANNINDIYTLFEFLGPGVSGFRTFEGFKKYFSQFRKTDHGDVFEHAKNLPVLKDRIARYSYMVTKEEAMPWMPDKVFDAIEVEMEPDQHEAYVKLRDELIIEMEATLSAAENEALAVNNILTQLLRLSQITSSFRVIPEVVDPDGNVVSPRRVIPFPVNVKVKALLELLPEKGPNDKTIVWSNYVEDIKATEQALIEAGEKPVVFYGATSYEARLEAERAFNHDPECRWFIGNPAAGGTGLNLLGYPPDDPSVPTNCNHTIYMSQNWSMIHREQSEDRAHRRGTRVPVRITEMIVPGTIDQVIAERLMKKRMDALSVFDVRDILNNIRVSLGGI